MPQCCVGHKTCGAIWCGQMYVAAHDASQTHRLCVPPSDKATHPTNRQEDWEYIIGFCDQINKELEGYVCDILAKIILSVALRGKLTLLDFISVSPQIAVTLLVHKIHSPQEWEALQALTVRLPASKYQSANPFYAQSSIISATLCAGAGGVHEELRPKVSQWSCKVPIFKWAHQGCVSKGEQSPDTVFVVQLNESYTWLCVQLSTVLLTSIFYFPVYGWQCAWEGKNEDCGDAVQLDSGFSEWGQDQRSLPDAEETGCVEMTDIMFVKKNILLKVNCLFFLNQVWWHVIRRYHWTELWFLLPQRDQNIPYLTMKTWARWQMQHK